MHTPHHSLFAYAALALTATTSTAGEPYPSLRLGDSWAYSQTRERGGLKEEPNTPLFSVAYPSKTGSWVIDYRNAKAPAQVPRVQHSIDQSGCIVDVLGASIVLGGSRCRSRLNEGESWQEEVGNPSRKEALNCKFVGIEQVKVAAGTYASSRIECESLRASTESGAPPRMATTFWYSETVRGMVQVERRFFTANGQLDTKITETLDAHTSK
jgi:hypothetical protein